VANSKDIDVAAVINDSGISGFQFVIFAVCVLIIMCDGFDTQALAYVASSIAAEWKLSPGSFGPVFAAVLLGSMAGAFAFGYLADRFGRKRTLLLCVIWFGLLNVGSAFASSIESFTQAMDSAGWDSGRLALFSFHIMGTARLGSSPKTSATKPDGETWEVRNLFVMDGSSFPSASGVNPMITIEAIAHRNALALAART